MGSPRRCGVLAPTRPAEEQIMADTSQGRRPATDHVEGGLPAASGWVVFAGVLLILVGSGQVIEGLVALFTDGYYRVRPGGLALHLDYTTWGWLHLVIGTLAALTGLGLLTGSLLARLLGIVLAAVSALVHLAFLAAYPVWSVLVIALDVAVIHAIVVHGRELRSPTYQ
jgi:hypothetical protein